MEQNIKPKMTISSKTLGQNTIGAEKTCFIIAEIGTDHNGDLKKAKELVEAVRETGADCAKFQIVFADEIIHKNVGYLDLPGGRTPIFDRFQELERGAEFYEELKDFTESKGLFFLCSVFGPRSTDLYASLEPDFVKIASPEINHYPLLKKVNELHLPIIISTGMSELSDMEKALNSFDVPPAFLHCVSSYPAPVEDYNLRIIPHLRDIFGVPIGVSDHSRDPILVPCLSVFAGATIIEKHICLKTGREGLDDTFALTPKDFKAMCTAIRDGASMSKEEAYPQLINRFGEDLIRKTLGTGRKRVSPSEKAHYFATRRSVRAKSSVPAGTRLTEENCGILRSSTDFIPGISPEFYNIIVGKRVLKPVREGDGITWDGLLTS